MQKSGISVLHRRAEQRTAAPRPSSPHARKPCAARGAPPEPVHTRQLLAGGLHPPPAPRTTTPSPEEPRRTADTPRHAPYPVRAERTTRNSRGACLPGKGNSEAKESTVPHHPAEPSQGASSPAPAAISPADLITSAQALRSSARVARARAHTPTARQSSAVPPPHAEHSRAEPEEPRRSAGALQTRAAPSKSRPERVWSARASATQVSKP